MDNLRYGDQKEFWKIPNERESCNQPDIDSTKLIDFLKDLNSDKFSGTNERSFLEDNNF